jgi:hypothetical protein
MDFGSHHQKEKYERQQAALYFGEEILMTIRAETSLLRARNS